MDHTSAIRYPKIGIRPVVDGRRNQSFAFFCEQTMRMAKMAKALYESRLTYPDGTTVKCVIPDRCIDGAAQAARCLEQFRREGVGLVLTVTSLWCYVTEVMHLDPLQPQAIWGLNGTERPGAIFLSAMLAAHNQMGLPAFQIYGRDVQDKDDETIPSDVEEKLLRFAKAGLAVACMRGRSYLGIGTVSMGIAGSMGHEDFFLHYLGMLYEHVDMCEIDRRIKKHIYDEEEFKRALQWAMDKCTEGKDWNQENLILSRSEKDAVWECNVKMAIIIRDMMIGNPKLSALGYEEEANGHNAIAAGFQGQRNWTDYMPNGDFPEAILCSSFDWNGVRAPFILATENDSLNAVTMLFMNLISKLAQGFADVRTYWSPEAVEKATGYRMEGRAARGFIHLINSGAAALDVCGEQKQDGRPVMKPFTEMTPEDVEACLEATTWGPANRESFYGGGFSSTFLTNGDMPVTMARLSLVAGLGPVLQIAQGYTVGLSENVFRVINERTDPTWPSTFFAPSLTGERPFTDVYSVMSAWGANHSAFCYGHIGADLITLASMLRIPVTMHNVGADSIFRPSVWDAFGTRYPEYADVLACKNFGALY